jgi:hypothetical protein
MSQPSPSSPALRGVGGLFHDFPKKFVLFGTSDATTPLVFDFPKNIASIKTLVHFHDFPKKFVLFGTSDAPLVFEPIPMKNVQVPS